jgi:hypothetical protein
MFDGVGHLSAALRRVGFRTLAFDYLTKEGEYRPSQDFNDPKVVEHLLRLVRFGYIFHIHFAIDCSTWSIIRSRFVSGTRSAARPWGDGTREDERAANKTLRNVLRLIFVCQAVGTFWSLENPRTSRIFLTPSLKKLMSRPAVVRVDLDMCCFGLADPISKDLYKKPTTLIGTLPGLGGLGRSCSGDHCHQVVEGAVQTENGTIKRSKLAGIYPKPFCALLANITRHQHFVAHDARAARLIRSGASSPL